MDPSALADDINTLCVNLALVGALVITMYVTNHLSLNHPHPYPQYSIEYLLTYV